MKYLLCAIDLFNNCAWVTPLKEKRGITIVNALQKVISKGRKPNKIWVDQGGEFYNKLLKRFLKINGIEIYPTYNEEKSVVAERFIRMLKNKIFKHMTAISKSVYLNVLDDIVNKYKNADHKTIKIKPIDVTSDSYAKYDKDSYVTKLKLKFGDNVRISKYRNIFAKGYTENWSEEVFVVSKIKSAVPWAYVISDLNGEPIAGSFMKENCQKVVKKNFG